VTPVVTRAAKHAQSAQSDERLVKECLAGKEEAWSELIEKYKALIYSIPVKYRLPPDEASEVFQATCVELLKSLPQLREPKALPKWLMQVAHHQCYRWKQQQQRLVSREEQMLRNAMAALSPQCRRLVELLFFETPSRPYAEVAEKLGLAVGSIGFTRQKCMDRLRKHLSELGFD
jgi:DNA-directed RNA polymerase specialized sigma24 family protein